MSLFAKSESFTSFQRLEIENFAFGIYIQDSNIEFNYFGICFKKWIESRVLTRDLIFLMRWTWSISDLIIFYELN